MGISFRQYAVIAVIALSFSVGCGSEIDGELSSPSSNSESETTVGSERVDSGAGDADATEPSTCARSEGLESLHARTGASIHELRTHGASQLHLGRTLMIRLLLTNWSLYDSATQEEIRDLLAEAERLGLYDSERPLEFRSDGTWNRSLGPDSRFSLRFSQPNGRTITENVFALETYLEGVEVAHDMSFEEMREYPNRKNTWTVSWDERGPLFHLLNGMNEPPNPFVVHASLIDLAGLAFGLEGNDEEDPDFGPFEALFRIDVESSIVRSRTYDDGTHLRYTAGGPPQSVGRIVRKGRIPFALDSLHASDGRYALETDAAELEFVEDRLVGLVEFDVEGPANSVASLTTEFSTQRTGPTAEWTCQ